MTLPMSEGAFAPAAAIASAIAASISAPTAPGACRPAGSPSSKRSFSRDPPSALLELGDGLAPLLDELLDDRHDVGVGQFHALVHLALLQRGEQQPQRVPPPRVAAAHGSLEIVVDAGFERHVRGVRGWGGKNKKARGLIPPHALRLTPDGCQNIRGGSTWERRRL